jgi:glycosyltransferase involved in cell wall biosynthesis
MRVLFDHQIFVRQRFGGIGRYFTELSRGLSGVDGIEVGVIAPWFINAHLRADAPAHLQGAFCGSTLCATRSFARIVRDPYLRWIYRRTAVADVVHETYYDHRVHARGQARVLTVFDMIHELVPEVSRVPDERRVSAHKGEAVRRADHIICISAATQRDLIRLFGVDERKTSVIHLGFSRWPSPEEAPAIPQNRPFLLYVGERGSYKGFERLLTAYAASPRLRAAVDLVAFGGGPFSAGERARIAEAGLAASVRQVSGDDARLAAHYRHAVALVYPSRYEGFGIPPLEAMHLGCPVVCSETSAISEVVGEAGAYCEPTVPESIREVIEQVVFSETRRATLIAAGHARASSFSWERCVRETAAVYRALA